MAKKPQLPVSVLTAQEFVGVDEVSDNILYTKDCIMYAYLSVRAMGDSLSSEEEKHEGFERVTRALEKERYPWQLISMPRALDTNEMITHLLTLRKNTVNEARLSLLNGEIDFVQEMARNGAREPMILLKLWQKEDKVGEHELEKRLTELASDLRSIRGMVVSRLTNQEISLMCKQFAELGSPQTEDVDTGELPVLEGKGKYKRDIDLLNEITPVGGITVKNNQITMGGTVGRLFAVSGYPREVRPGWLNAIMNNTEAVTSLTFDPGNPGELADALSRSIRNSRAESISSKDPRASKTANRKAQDADQLLDELDSHNEIVGKVCIVTFPFSDDEDKLEEVVRTTTNLFRKHRLKVKAMGQLQKEGLQCVSPYWTVPKIVDQAFTRLMPLYTLAGGSPMSINSYQDEGGFYFAKTNTGNVVSLNNWYRGGDRTNTNGIALGKPGTGKSTLIKHIIQTEIMAGTKILCIDPEGEYKEITERLGGSVFYAGGGGAMINILQVRPSPKDEDEEDPLYSGGHAQNDLAMHLKNMDTFFRTYMEGEENIVFAVLEKSLVELYREFGITWTTDCSKIPNDKFPIISDLYNYVAERAKDDKVMQTLAARLNSAAEGADMFLFNGHTNIDIEGDILCFNTKKLQNADDRIKRAQYLNILSLCWDRMSRDIDEKVLLLTDEGYLLVDHNLPQSLMYLRNIEKRCRKFNAALWFITHSVVDLLHPNVRQYGQALLDLPTYKYFMGTDGQNLKELTALYDLTDAQQDILRTGNRAEALGMIGSSVMHLFFDLPKYKLDNMGKAGGN